MFVMTHNIMKNYSVSDDEWEAISSFFPQIDRGVGRRRYSNRIVFEAMIAWLMDGLATRRCTRYLGVSYATLSRRLNEWIDASVFERLWGESISCYSDLVGLDLSRLLMDGAIVIAPNGGEATGRNPTDRGKTGSKRSLCTEARGIPLSIAVSGANAGDRSLVAETLDTAMIDLPLAVILSLDAGYTGARTRQIIMDRGLVCVVSSRAEPASWLRSPIECAHSLFNRYRGLKVRVLRLASRWLASLQLAAAIITFRATSRGVLKPM